MSGSAARAALVQAVAPEDIAIAQFGAGEDPVTGAGGAERCGGGHAGFAEDDAEQFRRRLKRAVETAVVPRARRGVDVRRAHRNRAPRLASQDRKSTRLNSSHSQISYAVFCLKK